MKFAYENKLHNGFLSEALLLRFLKITEQSNVYSDGSYLNTYYYNYYYNHLHGQQNHSNNYHIFDGLKLLPSLLLHADTHSKLRNDDCAVVYDDNDEF